MFAVDAGAEEWSHRGLLRSRDLSPLVVQGYASGSTVEDSTVPELTEGKY